MVLTVSSVLPGDRALLPPSLADIAANLTPASGRQDHTSSPSAAAPFVRCAIRAPDAAASIASRTNVRDDREAPLLWDGMAGVVEAICPTPKAKYFCDQGWTATKSANELICPSGRSRSQDGLSSLRNHRREPLPRALIERLAHGDITLLLLRPSPAPRNDAIDERL